MSNPRESRRRLLARLIVAGSFVGIGEACRGSAPSSGNTPDSAAATSSSNSASRDHSDGDVLPDRNAGSLLVATSGASASAIPSASVATAVPSASAAKRVNKVVPFVPPPRCPVYPPTPPNVQVRRGYCGERVRCVPFDPAALPPEYHLPAPYDRCTATMDGGFAGPGQAAFVVEPTREARMKQPNICCYQGLEIHPAGRPFGRVSPLACAPSMLAWSMT